VSAAAEPLPRAEILGDWRGTSKCVNLEAAPACKDEIVLYHFLPIDGASDKVLLKADKQVNGAWELMGELELHFRAADGSWEGEFSNPRVHILWNYTIKGRQMTGTLISLPDRTLLRKAAVTKL
jgi:hypothetical protein